MRPAILALISFLLVMAVSPSLEEGWVLVGSARADLILPGQPYRPRPPRPPSEPWPPPRPVRLPPPAPADDTIKPPSPVVPVPPVAPPVVPPKKLPEKPEEEPSCSKESTSTGTFSILAALYGAWFLWSLRRKEGSHPLRA